MGSVATRQWSRTSSCATLQTRYMDEGRSLVLELSGEADIATMGLLRQELGGILATRREGVVVDVHHLAFCDVSSAQLLLSAQRRNRVTVSGATGSVKRVLALLEAPQQQRLPLFLAAPHPV